MEVCLAHGFVSLLFQCDLEAVFTLGDVDFNFICLNGTFDVDVKI